MGICVKAYLVTRDSATLHTPGLKVIHIPFADEDTLYVFDERVGYLEIRGREKIQEFINRLRSEKQTSQ